MLTLRLAAYAETDLTEAEYDTYEAAAGERPETLWRFRIEEVLADDSALLNIAGTAADAQLYHWVELSRQLQEYPFYYLTRLPGEEVYCYFAPDDTEIVTIEPISAAFHARHGQHYLECELCYTRWVASAGRKLTYSISCYLDRAEGCPLVEVTNMQLQLGFPE